MQKRIERAVELFKKRLQLLSICRGGFSDMYGFTEEQPCVCRPLSEEE
jgi:hypothetical protein